MTARLRLKCLTADRQLRICFGCHFLVHPKNLLVSRSIGRRNLLMALSYDAFTYRIPVLTFFFMCSVHCDEDSLTRSKGLRPFELHTLYCDVRLHLDIVDGVDVESVHRDVLRVVQGDMHFTGCHVEVLRRYGGHMRPDFRHRRC